jgi:hypothetical protein
MIAKIPQILLFGFLLVSCKLQTPDQELKVEAVKTFYQTILTFRDGGIPTGTNLKKLTPLISVEFRTNLQSAREAEERHFKQTKGEEPPLVEGSLFYSLFEGAERVMNIQSDSKSGTNTFLVDLEFGDPTNKNAFARWSDRAIVVKENGKWVVDDLELLGDWQFGAKGKLSTILHSVVKFDQKTQTSDE